MAEAKPRPKPVVNLSSNSVPINERRWMDIDTQPFDHSCFEVSKFMTRTLRHDSSIPQDEDGAVKFDDLIEKLKVKFADTLQWTVITWVNSLAKGGGKKKSQHCLIPYSSNEILYFRAIQGHSAENLSLTHHCKTIFCYRMTSPSTSTTSGTPTRCTPLSKVD